MLSAPAAHADDAAQVYDPSTVFFVDLTLSGEAEAALEDEPDEYVIGGFSMTKSSDGTPTGEEASPFIAERPAEIRLKGSVGGSFRDLTEKAGFKLKFKKTDAVLGLRKMTFNNMVQDPSQVHETLAYAAFRANGVPASRTGYAYVRLNGHDLGVYLNLENLDDIGLSRIFGATFDDETQHLYEGERGDDVVPGGETDFEVDEGPDDISDLEALIEAANGDGDSPWSQRVAPHADLVEMARMWAVEKYIDHWDGYAGHVEDGQERPNNFYLYSDPSGRFQMLPWGTDQTWIPTIGVGTPGREVTFDGAGGLLFNKCLEDDECFRLYWGALNLVTQATPSLDPASLAEDTASMLALWQEEELDNGRPEFDATEIEDGVEETLEFIAGRQAEAEEWLVENKPVEKIVVDPVSRAADAVQPGRGPALAFSRSARSGRQLTTRVQVSSPGQVSLRASFKAAKKRKRACATGKRVQAAGEIALHCSLSREAMKRLADGALRLKLTIKIALAAGGEQTIVRSVKLRQS